MPRKYCVIANWKCNGTTAFVRDIVTNLYNDLVYDYSKLDMIVLPGMLHVNLAKARLVDHVMVGAQNVSANPDGAFTGEVSAEQLADYEIGWVLVGHNERRRHHNETQEIVNAKVKQARDANLGLIYCVGETLEEREAEQTVNVIEGQLNAVKEIMEEHGWENVIIGYEPIWAMNTGRVSSADQTQEAHEVIRSWLETNCSQHVAKETRILYAGPITETNTDNIIKLPDVDGFLMGSMSCKPAFRSIFEMVNNHVVRE